MTDAPATEDEAVVRDGLGAYNFEKAGYRDYRPLAILVSDPETGEVVGGLLGRTSFGLLYVDRFFLPEALRKQGLGGRILKAAEEEGARRGCSHAILTTLSFQAPGLLQAARLAGAWPNRMRPARPHPLPDDQDIDGSIGCCYRPFRGLRGTAAG